MQKFFQTPMGKIILILLITIIASWIFKSYFINLYDYFTVQSDSSVFILISKKSLDPIFGFLSAYMFFASFLTHLIFKIKHWIILFFITSPILLISSITAVWPLFIWYIATALIGYLVALLVRKFILNKF